MSFILNGINIKYRNIKNLSKFSTISLTKQHLLFKNIQLNLAKTNISKINTVNMNSHKIHTSGAAKVV